MDNNNTNTNLLRNYLQAKKDLEAAEAALRSATEQNGGKLVEGPFVATLVLGERQSLKFEAANEAEAAIILKASKAKAVAKPKLTLPELKKLGFTPESHPHLFETKENSKATLRVDTVSLEDLGF